MKEIYFANPNALYFLFLTVLIVTLLAYSLVQRKKALRNFAETESLEGLLFLEKRTILRYIIIATVWLLGAIALMQPEQIQKNHNIANNEREIIDERLADNLNQDKVLVRRRACDVIFALDTSASMKVKDTRQQTCRLDFAKEVVDEIISGLDGQNVVLYSFTSALTSVSPSTLDYFFTRIMLKDMDINYGDIAGTDLFETLDQISKKHFKSGEEKQKVLVLLTDGGDTYIDSLPKSERDKQIEILLEKLGDLKKNNVRIFTIGLGSNEKSVIPGVEFEGQPVLSSLDSELLKKLSQKGRGQYFFANDYSAMALANVILDVVRAENSYIEQEEIPHKKLERSIMESNPVQMKKNRLFQLPLGLAVLLFAFELLLPQWPVATRKMNL